MPRAKSPIKLAEQQAAEFYTAYPIHKGKADAIKACVVALRRGDVTFERLMIATNAFRESEYVQSRLGTDDEHYIPYPATWIRRGRYDDEVSKRKKPKGRPHFTREQANRVWLALSLRFSMSRVDWEDGVKFSAYVQAMCSTSPLAYGMSPISVVEFDEFEISIDPSVSCIIVRGKTGDDEKVASAQSAIDDLLASWKSAVGGGCDA